MPKGPEVQRLQLCLSRVMKPHSSSQLPATKRFLHPGHIIRQLLPPGLGSLAASPRVLDCRGAIMAPMSEFARCPY